MLPQKLKLFKEIKNLQKCERKMRNDIWHGIGDNVYITCHTSLEKLPYQYQWDSTS